MKFDHKCKDDLIEDLIQQEEQLNDLQDQYIELLTKYQSLCEELTVVYEEFDLVFEASGVGMCLIDKEYKIIKINRPLAEMIKLNEDEVAGTCCYDILKGNLCHTDCCPVTKIRNGEKSVICEDEKEQSGGLKYSCQITAIPVRDSQGELVAVIEIFKKVQ